MKIKLDQGAFLPESAHDADAGYDLRNMKYRSANLSEFDLHCEGMIGKGCVFHGIYIAKRRGRRVYEGVFTRANKR